MVRLWDNIPLSGCFMGARVLKDACCLWPVCKQLAPLWDLLTVLDALSHPPFKPLYQVDLKVLSQKTALLLALASSMLVSDIPAFSVYPVYHSVCHR